MRKLIRAILVTLPLLVIAAIGINQSTGVIAGEGHARTHDFQVTATTFNLDISDPDAAGLRSIHLSVPVKDIDTGRRMRNFHMTRFMLKAKKYPEITFDAKTDVPLTPGQINLNGKLTINGISKSHDLVILLSDESGALVASGETVITLSDYNLPLAGMGPMKVLDHVEMAFNIILSIN